MGPRGECGHSTVYVGVSVAGRCNLQCVHCHACRGVPLRAGVGKDELREVVERAVALKPTGHHLAERAGPSQRVM